MEPYSIPLILGAINTAYNCNKKRGLRGNLGPLLLYIMPLHMILEELLS
jgi:hypothetical protein